MRRPSAASRPAVRGRGRRRRPEGARQGPLGEAGAQRRGEGALQHADPALEGVALGAGRGELRHEAVAFTAQLVGVGAAAAALEGVDGDGRDQGALGAGLADGLTGQAPGLEVPPDRALGDPEGLGGLGDGDGVGGGCGVHAPGVRRVTPDSLSEPGVMADDLCQAGLRWISMFH